MVKNSQKMLVLYRQSLPLVAISVSTEKPECGFTGLGEAQVSLVTDTYKSHLAPCSVHTRT